MRKSNENQKLKKSPTKMKTMRLSNEAINIVNKMAANENRNFTNMVETLIYRANHSVNKTKMAQ